MGLLSAIDLFGTLRISGPSKTHEEHDQSDELSSEQKEIVIGYLKARSIGE